MVTWLRVASIYWVGRNFVLQTVATESGRWMVSSPCFFLTFGVQWQPVVAGRKGCKIRNCIMYLVLSGLVDGKLMFCSNS
jgi:hypothetical protein